MSAPRDHDDEAGASGGSPAGADKGGHLSYVAHEIRNPLSTALWTAELLARLSPADRGGARGEKLAGICLRSVGRVRQLVEDHLLCERLDAGGYPVRVEPILLWDLLEPLQARWIEGVAPLTLAADRSLAALADRSLLERALDGLLAIAAAEGRPVTVEARVRERRLEIRVTGGPVGSLEDPAKGSPSDQTGRSLALPMVRRVAVALRGGLTVDGEGYLLAIPAA
jgi:signal transduction histidine kinase